MNESTHTRRLTHGLCAAVACVALAASGSLGPKVEAMEEEGDCGSFLADCDCSAQYKETKIQPGFQNSCLESVTATVLLPIPGCCSHGEDDLIVCLPDDCEWLGIRVEVTPTGSCTIRTVTGDSTGTPMTITSKTGFNLPKQTTYCSNDLDDLFRLQVRNDLGVWVDCFELTLHCGECGARQEDDE